MLDALKFVQGAVAKKDFVPELTHFHINNGGILGYNGNLALYSPIPLNLNVRPKATPLIKAIKACKGETITLHMTSSGRLSVKSGAFKAQVDCLPDTPDGLVTQPSGQEIVLKGGLLALLKKLYPYIAEDASRPWARGILFRGPTAVATNNVVIVEHWLNDVTIPVDVNIPKNAIAELLRVNEEPVKLMVDEGSITFFFEGDRWMKAQTYSTEWPDIQKVFKDHATHAIQDDLWDAVEQLLPLVEAEETLYMSPDGVATNPNPEQGAHVEVSSLAGMLDKPAMLNIHQFFKLKGMAKVIGLSAYPDPIMFYGDMMRGAIAGLRPRG